jgi:hypothetical protein
MPNVMTRSLTNVEGNFMMKRFAIAVALTVGAGSAALAADLPPPAPAPRPKKPMQLELGLKNESGRRRGNPSRNAEKIILLNATPEVFSWSTIGAFLPDSRPILSLVRCNSMKSLSRGRHPGDACPSLRDAAVTRTRAMAPRPVTRLGGSTDQTLARWRSVFSTEARTPRLRGPPRSPFLIAAVRPRSCSPK